MQVHLDAYTNHPIDDANVATAFEGLEGDVGIASKQPSWTPGAGKKPVALMMRENKLRQAREDAIADALRNATSSQNGPCGGNNRKKGKTPTTQKALKDKTGQKKKKTGQKKKKRSLPIEKEANDDQAIDDNTLPLKKSKPVVAASETPMEEGNDVPMEEDAIEGDDDDDVEVVNVDQLPPNFPATTWAQLDRRQRAIVWSAF